MRLTTIHDLMIHSVVVVGCCLVVLVMQIVMITKSTIPADTVIEEIRIFRNEVANQHLTFDRRLNDVEFALDLKATRANTIKTMENNDGVSTN